MTLCDIICTYFHQSSSIKLQAFSLGTRWMISSMKPPVMTNRSKKFQYLRVSLRKSFRYL